MFNRNNTKHLAEQYKSSYPPGTRIKLLHMSDDPHPIADNTRGTVSMVDDLGTVHCSFDNGRNLGLVPGVDSFRKLTPAELSLEQGRSASLDQTIASAEGRRKDSVPPSCPSEPERS